MQKGGKVVIPTTPDAESRRLIESYHKSTPVKLETPEGARDADLVSQHIDEVLSEPTFSLTPASFAAIHRKLFHGVLGHAGKIRDYNITKAEWVLDHDTVPQRLSPRVDVADVMLK